MLHNDDQQGYWIIVSGRVYDMNEFNDMHPGGAKIIQSYSGMDATIAYQKVEHHINSEVDAMLGMYELGVLRTPNFGQEWGVALSNKGLRIDYSAGCLLRLGRCAVHDRRDRKCGTERFSYPPEPFTDIETV